MKFLHWLKALSRTQGTRPKSGGPAKFIPVLEILEDRTVPSTLMVTNNNDLGPGSLRNAIVGSHAGDTIRFDASLAGQTITLKTGELAINHNLKIVGLGSGQLTIDGSGQTRIFDISAATKVSISGLTLADGLAGAASPNGSEGGGIFDSSGRLALRDVIFSNDGALGSTGGAGQNGGAAQSGAPPFRGEKPPGGKSRRHHGAAHG